MSKHFFVIFSQFYDSNGNASTFSADRKPKLTSFPLEFLRVIESAQSSLPIILKRWPGTYFVFLANLRNSLS